MVLRSSGQGFCSLPLSWDLSDVYVMIRLGSYTFGSKAIQGKRAFHHVTLRVRTVYLTYCCRCWPWSPSVYQRRDLEWHIKIFSILSPRNERVNLVFVALDWKWNYIYLFGYVLALLQKSVLWSLSHSKWPSLNSYRLDFCHEIGAELRWPPSCLSFPASEGRAEAVGQRLRWCRQSDGTRPHSEGYCRNRLASLLAGQKHRPVCQDS